MSKKQEYIEKARAKGLQRNDIPETPETAEPQPIEIEPSGSEPDDESMANTKNLLERMRGTLPSIPGLNEDAIVEKLINTNKQIQESLQPYKTMIDEAKTSKDREKAQEQLNKQLNVYKKQIKTTVQEQVDIIRVNFKAITEACSSLSSAIPTFIAGMALPKCVGPVTPNPATAAIEAQQFKSTCGSILNSITISAQILLAACIKINFPVPDVVKTAIEGITILSNIIDSIPG